MDDCLGLSLAVVMLVSVVVLVLVSVVVVGDENAGADIGS